MRACVCVRLRLPACGPLGLEIIQVWVCVCVRERTEILEQLSSLSRPRGCARDLPMSASCSVSQPLSGKGRIYAQNLVRAGG